MTIDHPEQFISASSSCVKRDTVYWRSVRSSVARRDRKAPVVEWCDFHDRHIIARV